MATPAQHRHEPGPHTWSDFIALDEDDPRELIDGHFLAVDVPTAAHEHIVARLIYFLTAWAMPLRAGVVLSSGYKIKIHEKRGLMPDVQFYRAGRKLPEQGLAEGAPDLAVEIVSPSSSSYDRVTKLNWYASIGVPEYWIIVPEEKTLERLMLETKRYLITHALRDDDVFAPETFEGLSIPLAELWLPENVEG